MNFITVGVYSFNYAALREVFQIRIYEDIADILIYLACAIVSRFIANWLQHKFKDYINKKDDE